MYYLLWFTVLFAMIIYFINELYFINKRNKSVTIINSS